MEMYLYSIKWRVKQLFHKLINKPVKGYKRVLTIKEIIELGRVK